jgi:hypothetical protein
MIPEPFRQQIAEFPAPLRALVEAELQAGNTIVAIEHGFPAAPCGASVKLANAVQDVNAVDRPERWSSMRATTLLRGRVHHRTTALLRARAALAA